MTMRRSILPYNSLYSLITTQPTGTTDRRTLLFLPTNSPSISGLISSIIRNRIYPLRRFRTKIVSWVARRILWEPPEFNCTVLFAVNIENQERLKVAAGLLDTGLPMTLICCDLVKEHLEPCGVHFEKFHGGPKTIFHTVDGTEIRSTGVLTTRVRINADTKFINASFYVSEHPTEGCEVLIGADILKEHYRLVPLGAPGFRVPPPISVSQEELDEAEQAKQKTALEDRNLKLIINTKQAQNSNMKS